MTTTFAIDIPQQLSDVSPEWLTTALSGKHPGAEVASVRAESLHQGTASTWRLHLKYADESRGGPQTLCVKSDFALSHAARLASAGLYRKEAMVYLDLLPATSARTAICYAANYNNAGRGFMLMEDIFAAGGRFCSPAAALSVAQVATGVDQLAKLHASTWESPKLPELDWAHHGVSLSEVDPLWSAQFADYATSLGLPHAGAMARIFRDADAVEAAFNRLRGFDHATARSLIHGDAHVGNFFMDKNGDLGMADFQCVQLGHFTHDLSMLIGSSLDIIDRRENEQALLRRYLGELERLGVPVPDFEETWLGYRRHLLYSLVVWLFTTDAYQPQLHLVTNVFRYSMAALDLDSLGALQ